MMPRRPRAWVTVGDYSSSAKGCAAAPSVAPATMDMLVVYE